MKKEILWHATAGSFQKDIKRRVHLQAGAPSPTFTQEECICWFSFHTSMADDFDRSGGKGLSSSNPCRLGAYWAQHNIYGEGKSEAIRGRDLHFLGWHDRELSPPNMCQTHLQTHTAHTLKEFPTTRKLDGRLSVSAYLKITSKQILWFLVRSISQKRRAFNSTRGS